MSDIGQFLGAGKRRLLFLRMVRTSQTFNVPAGILEVIAAGGAASGGAVYGSGSLRATGGGAGALCRKVIRQSGIALTITAGAGGLGVTPGATLTPANGNDGTAVTVVGAGINMSAGGGKAGKAAASAIALTGGDGGVATGGDWNFDGGRGGSITSTAAAPFATGGGALNLFGLTGQTGTRAGDISTTTPTVSVTGGGGVGGIGGDRTSSAGLTLGGGAGGDAIANSATAATGAGPAITGVRGDNVVPSQALMVQLIQSFFGLLEPTGSGDAVANGGGAKGVLGATANPVTACGGGSGGMANTSAGSTTGSSSADGGASGGVIGNSSCSSAKAGDGWAIVAVYGEDNA